jgi:N-methylhydantoinase B
MDFPNAKVLVAPLKAGDAFMIRSGGGGGYGDPLERDAEMVAADVLDGKVSRASAREAYGVVLTADGTAVDELATKESREALRRARGRIDWLFDRGVDGRQP